MLRLLLVGTCVLTLGVVFHASTASTQPVRSEVVVDEETHTVRILVAGKELVVIDATGLTVNGDINYRGTITDIGLETQDAP